MRRIFLIVGVTILLASCNKVGQKFDERNAGSDGAATSSSNGNSPDKGASMSTTTSADPTAGGTVEKPNPTDAQKAAIAGGEEVRWEQQGMSWTLPQGWIKSDAGNTTFNYRSSGNGDFGFLIVNVSPLGADFPTDVSLKAMYDQNVTRKKNGELEDVRWMELDGVKGVLFREAMPAGQEDPRRLQWLGYRKYAGQTQMINLMLSTKGRSFEKDADMLYGIMYSTKLVH